MERSLVMALGGNSLLKAGREFSVKQEQDSVRLACREIARIFRRVRELAITHGNGPQVGDILLQQKMASRVVPSMPLDVCGAQTQGELGYLIERNLRGLMPRKDIASVLTQVIVSERDPAFANPSKFIGPFFRKPTPGLKRDGKRGFRRVVPSPRPLEIVEISEIKSLVKRGILVIACGGGGIPVVRRKCGLEGVEAVIDKDFTSSLLARRLGADTLIILTDIDGVYRDFGTPNQRLIRKSSSREMESLLRKGQFPPGSMGPKIRASLEFLRFGGKNVIITSPEKAFKALTGKAGTVIVK